MDFKYIFSADLSETNCTLKKIFEIVDNIALTSRNFSRIDECLNSANEAIQALLKQIKSIHKDHSIKIFNVGTHIEDDQDYPEWTPGEIVRLCVFEDDRVLNSATKVVCETRIYQTENNTLVN